MLCHGKGKQSYHILKQGYFVMLLWSGLIPAKLDFYLVESVIVIGVVEQIENKLRLVALGGVVRRVWHSTRQKALLVGRQELLYHLRVLQQGVIYYSFLIHFFC